MKKIILLFSFTITNLVFAPFEPKISNPYKSITHIVNFEVLLASADPKTICVISDATNQKFSIKGVYQKEKALKFFKQLPHHAFIQNFKTGRENLLVISRLKNMPLEKLLKEIWGSLPS